jgi:hypothetical protein
MPASRSVQQGNHCAREDFLYELKAGLRAAACGGRPRPTAAPPAVARRVRPWLLLHGYSHAVTHQHLSAVSADHAKDDVELKARWTWRGRHSLEMRCTRSTC